MRFNLCSVACVASLVLLAGCTTEQAKKAMDRPIPQDQYSGFGAGAADGAKRKADKPKEIKDDTDPETAVTTLTTQLKSSKPGYAITAEEQLTYWGGKPGVAPIVVNHVRQLLKDPEIGVRAPALRLTIMFGGKESVGDYIECLADKEYGIRETAYKAMENYIPRDFGFDASGGEVARSQSIEQMRRWWQYEARKGTVLPPATYEKDPPAEATVRNAHEAQQQAVNRTGDLVR